MNKRVTFRNLEKTPDLETHIQYGLVTIEKFLARETSPISIELVVEAHPTHAHNSAEIRIKSPNYNVIVKRESPEVAAAINEVLHIAHAELAKAHELIVSKRTHHNAHDKHRPE